MQTNNFDMKLKLGVVKELFKKGLISDKELEKIIEKIKRREAGVREQS